MEFLTDFTAIPALVVICYLAAEALKLIKDGVLKTYLPVICGVLGAVLGIVCFVVYPDIIVANNIFEAIAIGIVSGLSATGINQVFKQLSNNAKG
jgi:uncharacterized membrane protein